MKQQTFHSTTILTVRKGSQVALGGDGQVSFGETILKGDARKIRRLGEGKILVGFAGAAADAFWLLDRLNELIESHHGNLMRAATEMVKAWRSDRILRRLECLLAVVDQQHSLLLSGAGELVEPSDGIIGIGSGGTFALSAARALLRNTELDALEVVTKALEIAGEICVYTNQEIQVESL